MKRVERRGQAEASSSNRPLNILVANSSKVDSSSESQKTATTMTFSPPQETHRTITAAGKLGSSGTGTDMDAEGEGDEDAEGEKETSPAENILNKDSNDHTPTANNN